MNQEYEQQEIDSLKRLPVLSVTRTDYCSQEMTETLLSFMIENRPDLILDYIKALKERSWDLPDHPAKIFRYLRDEIGSQAALPLTRLGRMDFVFEVTRRICAAFDIKHFDELIGQPIATGPDAPLSPLLDVKVNVERHGASQEIMERLLPEIYKRRPDILYELAEALRRHFLAAEALRDLSEFINVVVFSEMGVVEQPFQKMNIVAQVKLHVYKMINVTEA